MADVPRRLERHIAGDACSANSPCVGPALPFSTERIYPARRISCSRGTAMVVFVHGCFWHRHPGCRWATFPKSRILFWKEKFEKNVARDRKATEELHCLGMGP